MVNNLVATYANRSKLPKMLTRGFSGALITNFSKFSNLELYQTPSEYLLNTTVHHPNTIRSPSEHHRTPSENLLNTTVHHLNTFRTEHLPNTTVHHPNSFQTPSEHHPNTSERTAKHLERKFGIPTLCSNSGF